MKNLRTIVRYSFIMIVTLVVIVGISILAGLAQKNGMTIVLAVWVLLLCCWPIATFILAIVGHMQRCPKCHHWFGRIKLQKEVVDRIGYYKTETKQDKIKDSNGEVAGTIEREVQAHYTTIKYSQHCKCRDCGHEWSYELSETTQD